MRLSLPTLIAVVAGGLSALTSFFLHAGAQNSALPDAGSAYETAVFAGGCFWCVEADFDKVTGVVETVSGYAGGQTTDPTYRTHSRDGHLEVVKVVYDPEQVTYETLVTYFLHHIDPTDEGGQFCDRGHSYTTAIFTSDASERRTVQRTFDRITTQQTLPGPIVTRIRDAVPFYEAEAYHQDYYRKNATRYNFYRKGCRRDARIEEVWSAAPGS
jgi:methionine-S-sulfoxide reductase